MVVHETPFIEVVHYPDAEALLIRWKQRADTSTFISAYLQGLEYVAVNQPIKYFCTDLTLVGSLQRDQESWLSLDYYHKVYDVIKDVIFSAIVFSEEHFKAIISNYQLPSDNQSHDFMHFNYFTSQEEAWNWLESIKKGQDVVTLPLAP